MSLSGSICALITPFSADGRLDLVALQRLIEHHIDSGTSALVIAGSTGEAAMLDDDEFVQLLNFAVERVAGRIPVLAGTGASSTARTVRQTRIAFDCGVDAALVATPAYVRPTQEGLYRHFLAVAEQGGLPVVLYNVPGRTACDLLPETVVRLHGHPAIVGIKEAVADPGRMSALLQLQGDTFDVLSGDDPTALAAMIAGARGVISVAANVVPGLFAELCDHALAGREDEARRLDGRLAALYAFLGVESNPIPAKWLLHRQGWSEPELRLPLIRLSPEWHGRAENVLSGLPESSRAAVA